MTSLERDRIAAKIVREIMSDLLYNTDLGVFVERDEVWEDGEDDEDKKNAIKRWNGIVKRFIPVDGQLKIK